MSQALGRSLTRADPIGEAWVVIAELLMLAEDAVKELIVGRVAEERVLEERKGSAVGRGEVFAHEVITAGEHRLEAVKRAGHPAREVSDARMGWVSTASPLWASANATRSTLVENGAR